MEPGTLTGSSLGSFRVGPLISRGSMGEVYAAEHALIGKRAAVKVALPELSRTRAGAGRFFNEARAAARMHHRGLAEIYDYGQDESGTPFIVMEYIEGETLDAAVDRDGAFAPAEALRIVRAVARAMSVAHAAGVVHRDLKPENIAIVRRGPASGEIKVLDFGIAKLEGPDEPRSAWSTLDSEIIGTPAFMAPEQCRAAGVVDARTDVYGLGGTLYFLLTGHAPFEHTDVESVLAGHLYEPVSPPSSYVPDLSPEIDALVLRMLAKRPEDRFTSMEAVHDALLALDSPASGATSGALARRTWMAAVAVAALALTAGFVGWRLADRGEGPRPAAVPAAKPVAAPPTSTPSETVDAARNLVTEHVQDDLTPTVKPKAKVRPADKDGPPPRESVKDGALDPFD
jgi:serine/threonine-protein kinase